MPIYEWHCPNCGTEKETLQSMNDPAPLCPKCCYNHEKQGKHEIMKKKISKMSFEFSKLPLMTSNFDIFRRN